MRRFGLSPLARPMLLGATCLIAPLGVSAQIPDANAQTKAQAEAGEPRAHTSPMPAPAATPAATPAPAPARAPTTTAVSPQPRTQAVKTPVQGTSKKTALAADRLDLGTATVTGEREQPKVMYIVPWKRSDIGDDSGKPMNSLLDEALAPVDRDEFKREVVYYQAVSKDVTHDSPTDHPAKQGEK